MTIDHPARHLGAGEREKGILLVIGATLAWSASGVYSRLLTTDVWTAIAWRSLFGGLFLLIPCLFLEGGISRKQWHSVLHPSGLAMIVWYVWVRPKSTAAYSGGKSYGEYRQAMSQRPIGL